ncbi:MAG: hypothetical protein EOP40_02465 [Rubrivivax sp.]|nr:MAG: hypothetical protein EOP40_02465 [Rubrivivax sp.]
MSGVPMDRWRRMAASLGMPGLMGLSLGLAVAWGWLVWWPGLQSELADAQDEAIHLRQQLVAGAGRPGTSASTDPHEGAEATWQALWAGLPRADEATSRQGGVLAAAASQGISIQTVQYRGALPKALPGLWRQQMSLPLEAPYPALRAWLGWLLQQPAISVDAVDIARTDPMSDAVKARVQVSLWWRTEASSTRVP